MNLTDVSKTAIATLRSHVIEAARPKPVIHDPMAPVVLERLTTQATTGEGQRVLQHPLSRTLTSHIALRARKYDAIANAYIQAHPGCTVVNLGCGFDTRYWRIDHDHCTYLELDLPEVIALKRALLGADLAYELIGASVLDPAWLDQVTAIGNRHVLLLAEGLFMYLPTEAVIELFQRCAATLVDSQITLEVVTKAYTHGLWKKIVEMKIKSELGVDAGASYNFGIKRAQEIEGFADGLEVIDEWSYVEDPDLYPKILKYMNITRSQWTVTLAINPGAIN
ncbi:MAG: class I SAM-dependent methyltransferase [Caldilineaceae bacterium]